MKKLSTKQLAALKFIGRRFRVASKHDVMYCIEDCIMVNDTILIEVDIHPDMDTELYSNPA